ncbi:MAG: carboxylate--amine ligase [Deltaproteobacteria bacterium RBG_16_54_11]|nr:MAG: carboxylate--amine ligase [Deltaproteobacteria bacterium RBG_16_54_11]
MTLKKDKQADDLIRSALKREQRALSEYESKKLLSLYGIPVTREQLSRSAGEAVSAAAEIGFPVVLKASSPELMHKSEHGSIELNLRSEGDVREAYGRIVGSVELELDGVLVQEMVPGQRELVIGLTRDPQFGPCVMLGIGGTMTEVFQDTVFRMAPFDMTEANDMTEELRFKKILGAFRGQKPVDMDTLCRALIAVGQIGLELEAVSELDINPLIIMPEGRVKAVDALVVLK